ncbi:hypothetical protein IC006_0575 [Sulfuracidifex tepidarius]|uniref:Uncharacterized protein n=1 Tax=Sulfuracidifex tepidarius TaxID=1294262 RepID=A0A510DSZ9_9CREN|nr:hypothetical protein [Sulfuracidifex tepidarius]BBG23291.1 hypothetical protein IC006_0575 [Sulfuracidifex tepidarius]
MDDVVGAKKQEIGGKKYQVGGVFIVTNREVNYFPGVVIKVEDQLVEEAVSSGRYTEQVKDIIKSK